MEGIRITTNDTPDYHDLDSLARSIIRPGMTNEEKALACYDVVRRGMFHYPWVYNVKEWRAEWHDATKLLNTYGHGLCGVQARTLGALCQKVFGYDNQRLIGLNEKAPGDWALDKDPGAFVFSTMQAGYSPQNASGHSCVEVFYDGHWHHLDPMVEFYCYTRDGSRIASLRETIEDPTLVMQPSRKIDGLMPDGDLGKVFCQSRFADWTPGPGYFMVMDTEMDVSLKPGQSVTWFWERMHERFFWPEIWPKRFSQDYFDLGPRHPNTELGLWRHYGNGTFLTEADVIRDGETMTLPFPYVLVGGTLLFEAESSVERIVMSCQKEDLKEWIEDAPFGSLEIHLDKWLVGGYNLAICPEGGNLDNVCATLFFQHNFMTRPRLMVGENVVGISGHPDTGNSGASVSWEWTDANGEVRRDQRVVVPPTSYAIDVGEFDVAAAENPKYMKRLEICV